MNMILYSIEYTTTLKVQCINHQSLILMCIQQVVGNTTSGAWSYNANTSICMAFLPPHLAELGTNVYVELLGRRWDMGTGLTGSFSLQRCPLLCTGGSDLLWLTKTGIYIGVWLENQFFVICYQLPLRTGETLNLKREFSRIQHFDWNILRESYFIHFNIPGSKPRWWMIRCTRQKQWELEML